MFLGMAQYKIGHARKELEITEGGNDPGVCELSAQRRDAHEVIAIWEAKPSNFWQLVLKWSMLALACNHAFYKAKVEQLAYKKNC